LKFFKNDRCRICKKRKGHRFCLRIGNDICWQDCNEMRVDLKCPADCKYALVKSDEDQQKTFFEYKTNADSQIEFTDLLKREIDKWINQPQEFLAGKTPLQEAENEAGKGLITSFFNEFNIPDYVPMNYLKQKLDLTELKVKQQKESYEDAAASYLTTVISFDWEKTLEFLIDPDKYIAEKVKLNYLKRISSDKVLSKLKEFNLISSALSEDKKTALVYFELNGKFELTLILIQNGAKWAVSGRIYGRPELFNGENEALQQVAVLLSKNKLSQAFTLLKNYSAIYPDSPDLYYYQGLYYSFLKNNSKAVELFYTAVEIDPDFQEAKYNYAFLLHADSRHLEAEQVYREILKTSPDEFRSLNNLASLLIDQGNYHEARMMLKKCIKINKDFEIAHKNLARLEKLENK